MAVAEPTGKPPAARPFNSTRKAPGSSAKLDGSKVYVPAARPGTPAPMVIWRPSAGSPAPFSATTGA
ncbi:hypothetical protein D3C72_2297270 [compost metagenome]